MIIEGILAVAIGILFWLVLDCCKSSKQAMDSLKLRLMELQGMIHGFEQRLKEQEMIIQELRHQRGPSKTESGLVSTNLPLLNPQNQKRVFTAKETWQTVLMEQKLSHLGDSNLDIALVLDKSGSMHSLYSMGIVQDTVERILAICIQLSNRQACDAWAYADRFARLPSIQSTNVPHFVKREIESKNIGGGNNEVLVMEDILKKYLIEIPSHQERIILFVTDGGIGNAAQIRHLMQTNQEAALFWQFIGMGQSHYGELENLQKIKNAHFFALDDLKTISDESLYKRIFNKFPEWLNNRKQKNGDS